MLVPTYTLKQFIVNIQYVNMSTCINIICVNETGKQHGITMLLSEDYISVPTILCNKLLEIGFQYNF